MYAIKVSFIILTVYVVIATQCKSESTSELRQNYFKKIKDRGKNLSYLHAGKEF
jgi:hypothetical protein